MWSDEDNPPANKVGAEHTLYPVYYKQRRTLKKKKNETSTIMQLAVMFLILIISRIWTWSVMSVVVKRACIKHIKNYK